MQAMKIVKVSPYYIESFLGILASPEFKYEDEVAMFDGTNKDDVKRVLQKIILPSYGSMGPWSKESAKETLKYYMNLGDFGALRWILEDIPNKKGEYNEHMFWSCVWEILFNGESPNVESLEGYFEVLDRADAESHQKELYESFIKSKRGGKKD